ncbi:MAG: DUF2071 domain-containing protein [Bdellovibrionales bacterium]|nr:DUF2071 domain-containing protein [Bdellovibrionales bacterium]
MSARPFLTAEWRYLAMLNFEIDPDVLRPLVPQGTEIDFFRDKTFVSLVGFRFLNTRVCGVAIPWHRDFEEINLRFYVVRNTEGEVRRGVCFVKEIVPRRAIATVARTIYGEPYVALPTESRVEYRPDSDTISSVEYRWKFSGEWNFLSLSSSHALSEPAIDSEEAFIAEHYWGYTHRRMKTSEYRVEHPPWKIWTADQVDFRCDVEALYGEAFVPFLAKPPTSAFIAAGSPVAVYPAGGLRG